MIILDIESTGINTREGGIWQIGAFELEKPENYFLQEGRIDDEDKIMEEALKIIGKTEEELRDKNKQSQKQLILNFLGWRKRCEEKITLGQNIGWDVSFIQNKCLKYGIMEKFREVMGQRSIDLHTIAQERYKGINGKYLLKENGNSDMNLTNVLKLCGIPDQRKQNINGKISEEGTPHNALEDCKLEGECYYRLKYGKNLFPEYSQFEIPGVLIK